MQTYNSLSHVENQRRAAVLAEPFLWAVDHGIVEL